MPSAHKPGEVELPPEDLGVIFYACCYKHADPKEVVRILLLVEHAQDAMPALESMGFFVQFLIQADRPSLQGFRYRPDGTILVGVSVSIDSVSIENMKIYGPFNDLADANTWIARVSDGASYAIIEPDECLAFQRTNGHLSRVEFPSSIWN